MIKKRVLPTEAKRNGTGKQRLRTFTACYTKVGSGYMGQLVEWPEVVTEGKTIEECRDMMRDALREMILVYQEDGLEMPEGSCLLEPVTVEL